MKLSHKKMSSFEKVLKNLFAWQRFTNAHAQIVKNIKIKKIFPFNVVVRRFVVVKENSVVTKSRKANDINHLVIRIMNEALF